MDDSSDITSGGDGASSIAVERNGSLSGRLRTPSPVRKSRRKLSTQNKQSIAYADLQSLYTDVLQKYKDEVKQKGTVLLDAKRNEELYLRRENRFREQIQNLQMKLDAITQSHGQPNAAQESVNKIRMMHTVIQENIGLLQGRTTQVLKDQEKDLLRAFKTRMCDVNEELERERRKNENGSSEWVQRCHKLTEELEWMKDMTYRLEEQNKQLAKDNKRLKSQMKTQEEDREFLIKQILIIKKDQARLRETAGASPNPIETKSPAIFPTVTERARPSTAISASTDSVEHRKPASAAPRSLPNPLGTEKHFTNAIRHLKHELDQSHRQAKWLQAKLNEQLNGRQELQEFLRTCIDDVKSEILLQGGIGNRNESTGMLDFNKGERSAVLSRLFSQETTLQTFYDQISSKRTAKSSQSTAALNSGSPSRHNLQENSRPKSGAVVSGSTNNDGTGRH